MFGGEEETSMVFLLDIGCVKQILSDQSDGAEALI